jgi:hypothetical protein
MSPCVDDPDNGNGPVMDFVARYGILMPGPITYRNAFCFDRAAVQWLLLLAASVSRRADREEHIRGTSSRSSAVC